MAKIAVPISDNKLSTEFSQCGHYNIYFIDQRKVVSKETYSVCSESVEELNNWVVNKAITDVIAHQMDKTLINYFSDTKINLFIGVSISTPEQLVDEYLKGTLQSNSKNL